MAIAYRHLAFVEWQRGNPAGAVDALQRAIKAGVTDRRVVAQLGGYLADTGRVGRRRSACSNRSRAIRGADAETLNALGIAYIAAGRRDEARATFERVLAINPDSSVPLENLGVMALERGRSRRRAPSVRARRPRRSAIVARARRTRRGRCVASGRSPGSDRVVDARRAARSAQLRRGLQRRHDARARDGQTDAARPYLSCSSKTAPAGVLCQRI